MTCVFVTSCSPNTFEDCLLDAAKISTKNGIALAEAACKSKYKKPLTEVEKIIETSVKCDTSKLDTLAKYIVINEKNKGEYDFEKVAREYVEIRDACNALNIK